MRQLRKKKEGSILFLSLWVVTCLTVFVVFIGAAVNQKILFVKRIEDSDKLRLAAMSAVDLGIWQLANQGVKQEFYGLKSVLSNNPEFFGERKLGGINLSLDYNGQLGSSCGDEVCYGVIDEESKINLNTASFETIKNLFVKVCALSDAKAEDLSNRIIDYRDNDDLASNAAAEEVFYGFASSAWLKNSNIEFIDELKDIPGMQEEDFNKIKSYVTIYGNGRVNINSASLKVLEILGLDSVLVKKISMFRKGADKICGTEDDVVEEEIKNYIEDLNKDSVLMQSEIEQLQKALNGLLTDKSSCVHLHAKAGYGAGKRLIDVDCVYDVLSGSVKYWRESIKNGA
ncbi:MAG: general secretion pathway protein GspK [Candidatus Omnitrophica bacterium]|jgi:DNA uptake protein ComE-like DNA-binding protein|nr:general secretion pathway protein GspK [Candidatus Omnitrophota bacterium]